MQIGEKSPMSSHFTITDQCQGHFRRVQGYLVRSRDILSWVVRLHLFWLPVITIINKHDFSAVADLFRKFQHVQGDHSPDCVKFPDISLTAHGSSAHVKCYLYHAGTSVSVSGGRRNRTVHDPKPK